MAISFTTGTINQPDAGSVGLSMVEKIRDDLVVHPAWDLVEEFTPASGLVRWYIFKNLAAQSGLPADWYVVIGRTLGDGMLRFAICEDYNATGKVMSYYTRYSNSGSLSYDSLGRSPDTLVLSTTAWSTSGTNPRWQGWTPSGTSTKWWLTVADDGFTVAFNGASNGFIHCGRYIPLTAIPMLMPINLIGHQDSTGNITRNPAVAGITAQTASLHIMGGGWNLGSYGPILGFASDLRYNDKLQNNERPMAEQGMTIAFNSAGDQAITGWALGKQKRMRLTNQNAPVGFAFGDAYAMQGRLWVPYLPSDGRIWDTGVATS